LNVLNNNNNNNKYTFNEAVASDKNMFQ